MSSFSKPFLPPVLSMWKPKLFFTNWEGKSRAKAGQKQGKIFIKIYKIIFLPFSTNSEGAKGQISGTNIFRLKLVNPI